MFLAPKVDEIISVMKAKDYAVFKNTKGHDLNIVGRCGCAEKMGTGSYLYIDLNIIIIK